MSTQTAIQAPARRGSARRPRAKAEARALAWAPHQLLLGGAWREASSGRRLGVEDPSTGRTLVTVADATCGDFAAALDAACSAQRAWAASAPRQRARILRRAADALGERASELALVLTAEAGKPLAESEAEVEFAAEYLEWYAEEAVRVGGREGLLPDGDARMVVRRDPIGPCLILTPWNFPLAVPARGIAPALAAGCTVVLRPSALTPLSALALARILAEAGVPAGVLNVLASSEDGASDALIGDPRLRKLTFTGSEAVGRHLARLTADGALRTSMELGGCAPFIVFADADLDAAVEGAVQAKMRNGGAACTAANRFYVERSVAQEFTRRLAARLAGFRMGRGTRAGVSLGPMIAERQRARLSELVTDAVGRGARVALRGGALPGHGHFFAPVVLADVPDDARVMREEIFGPVAPVRAFDREDEVVALANDVPQGLAAYLYTHDLERAMRLAGELEAGMVALNRGRLSNAAAPFGGIKGSGHGRSGGLEGIGEYLETRYLLIPEA
jgi:succinate-semialdehyde dehydrogenase / glutarate-semialdehyde dehydrogenase